MDIFNNDHEVWQFGGLTIENHTDCIVIVGDVEIPKNVQGKTQAKALYEFAKQLQSRFEELNDDELSGTKSTQEPTKTIQNPFA